MFYLKLTFSRLLYIKVFKCFLAIIQQVTIAACISNVHNYAYNNMHPYTFKYSHCEKIVN